MQTRKIKKVFTLVELLVAMAVFSVLMLALMQFFSSAQKVWLSSSNKNQVYENARMAMDLITRDLQSVFYSYSHTPFYMSSNKIAFATTLPEQPTGAATRLAEVKYQLADGITIGSETVNNTIMVKYTDDTDGTWNFYDNLAGDPFSVSVTPDSTFSKLIPYVTDLSFKYQIEDGTWVPSPGGLLDRIPYAVTVQISMLDKESYTKWKASGNDDIKTNNLKTFTKTITLGNRY